MTRRSMFLALAVGAAACFPLAGCSGANAGLITVTDGPAGVTSLDVHLNSHDGSHVDDFTVTGSPIKFPATISITFPASVVGYIDANVTARANGIRVAYGVGFSSDKVIGGKVTMISIPLKPAGPEGGDGGAADLSTSD